MQSELRHQSTLAIKEKAAVWLRTQTKHKIQGEDEEGKGGNQSAGEQGAWHATARDRHGDTHVR
jgi:hypothetical protein